MNKAYNPIDWKNEPNTSTPINETNLNKMDRAIDTIDNRVISLDSEKVSKEEGKSLVSNTDISKIGANETAIQTHISNKSNPHSVTKAQVGLGNVDNTRDADKPISTAQQAEFDSINNNLAQLEYSDVAGGKNLLNKDTVFLGIKIGANDGKIYNDSIYMTTDYISVKESVYHFSNLKSFGSSNYGFAFFDSQKNFVSGKTYSSLSIQDKTDFNITVPSGVSYIRTSFLVDGTTLDNGQIEVGNTATEYEPYIPSVKMLAEEVSAQNDSLEEYGLNNVFDGNWSQGSYEGADSSIIHITNRVPCNGNETVRLISNKNEQDINIHYFDSSLNWITYNNMHTITDATFVTPSNAKYIGVVAYNDNGISIENAPSIKLYVGNEIDQLKNDLGGLKFSASGTTLTITDGTNTWSLTAN